MATASAPPQVPHSELKRSITARQLYFYVVGDVLGSGIYVLVGLVAAAVGGAFWMAFLAGVAIATITGLAYAELVTKYPQAAGASLYVNKAFRSPILTFLEVIRADLFFIPASIMLVLFGIIAMIAISNTALVTVVAQSRILYGMAREDVVPAIFAKVHPVRRSPYVALLFGGAVVAALLLIGAAIRSGQTGLPADEQLDIVDRLATITVVFLLFIYALVIVACLKLRGTAETAETYRANTPLLIVGIIGNLAVLAYTLIDDPDSLWWVAGLLAVGLVLYVLEHFFGKKRLRPPGAQPFESDPIAHSTNTKED